MLLIIMFFKLFYNIWTNFYSNKIISIINTSYYIRYYFILI
nr:MAG TPA: hypothetical protein [Bacteriophage sp.]